MKYDLSTKRGQVRYLIETVPGILNHPTLPLLLYWRIFDGCDIPKHVFESILAKGTPPDSLTRLVRFALQDIKADQQRSNLTDPAQGEISHDSSPQSSTDPEAE